MFLRRYQVLLWQDLEQPHLHLGVLQAILLVDDQAQLSHRQTRMRCLHIQSPFELGLCSSKRSRNASRLSPRDRLLSGNTTVISHVSVLKASTLSYSNPLPSDAVLCRILSHTTKSIACAKPGKTTPQMMLQDSSLQRSS